MKSGFSFREKKIQTSFLHSLREKLNISVMHFFFHSSEDVTVDPHVKPQNNSGPNK